MSVKATLRDLDSLNVAFTDLGRGQPEFASKRSFEVMR